MVVGSDPLRLLRRRTAGRGLMRVLVTGREGQLARSLAERAPDWADLTFAARPLLDLTDRASVERAVEAVRPDAIISAAAYTAVDRAEDEPDLAHAINAEGVAALARVALHTATPLIHVSTDYVFDGTAERPYRPDDPVGPLGVYGTTKLAGEEAIRASGADHAIVRTAWLYSPFGHNFVRTMLRLGRERDELTIVGDQVGNPTNALDLADGLFALLGRRRGGNWMSGTWHLGGSGETSWAGLAAHALATSGRLGGPTATVRPIATADYPTRAARPANSRINSDAFAADFGYRTPDWRQSVDQVVERLLTETPQ